MAKLKIVVSNRVVEYHDLKPRTVIGRSRQADVLLVDPAASREHAAIIQEGPRWILEDLGSANGTSVNQKPVTRVPLAEGDLISVGDTVIVFTHEEMPVAPEREVEVRDGPPADAASCEGVRDLAIRLPSTEPAVDAAGAWIGTLLARSCLGTDEAHYFQMALLEALTNAWRHGNQADAQKPILVRLVRDGNRVVCRVRDQGKGFDFRQSLEVGRRGDAIRAARDRYEAGGMGGLGIMLIVKCVDLIEFNESGNELTMVKCPGDVFNSATIYGGLGFTPEELPPREGR